MQGHGVEMFARCIRGVEWIAAAEIQDRLDVAGIDVAHRTIRFRTQRADAALLQLGCVDDVFFHCGRLEGIRHVRDALADVRRQVARFDLTRPVELLESILPLGPDAAFAVSASFLGKRNYNRVELEDAVGETLGARLPWRYESRRGWHRPDADMTFRVHLEGESGWAGLRLTAQPLHRRAYKTASRTGTLHPPLARAMSLLSGLQPGLVFHDPFCGAGTIPIEAARACPGLTCSGSDIDSSVIGKARHNQPADLGSVEFSTCDAACLPFDDGTVDRVASNLPWGRNVAPQGALTGNTAPFWDELARVLAPDGRAVVLFESDSAEADINSMRRAGLEPVLVTRLSLFGSFPTLCKLAPAGTTSQSLMAPEDTHAQALEQWHEVRLESGA